MIRMPAGPLPAQGQPSPRLPSSRYMISPEEALSYVLQSAQPLDARAVPLDDACGLRLAEEVRADRPYPAFPRAMMDGFAVRMADAGKTVKIAGEIAAGQPSDLELTDGHAISIMTGAVCPPGAEAVVQKEHVRCDSGQVRLPDRLALGSHIAPVGSECRPAALVLQPGDTIGPLAIAAMASFGMESVLVRPRPSLAIITTGAELVGAGQPLQPHQIRNSNGPMLAAMAREMGLDRPLAVHVVDRLDAIMAAFQQVSERDVVLLTGGVSAGDYDLVPEALNQSGAETLFHKVRQKPGKPLLLARRGRQLIFGLPGNPLACHLGFSRYVATALRIMQGLEPSPGPLEGRLTGPVSYRGNRTYFGLARADRVQGLSSVWHVVPLSGVSSADIFTPCMANCYVEVPPGVTEIPAGELVRFTWIPGSGD
ncbi:MAG: molybdopterin molybdotransferase MoeA [Pirellulales bacterium]|nr:molybdopterin molybdotransferase MoeA [Pirellulales bacterium]